MIKNDDWSNDDLLLHIGAYKCSKQRFLRLLEEIVHPLTRRDETEQRKIVEVINGFIRRDGFALEQAGEISGSPVYEVRGVGSGRERPLDAPISATLSTFDTESVHRAWLKALERRESDPEGAITIARTLLETVCKRVLDELGERYTDREELPKLYRMTAEKLNLAPDQHTEQAFREILGNCQAVVNGLAGLRNKLGDAHGKGRRPVRPAPRHAELAVNLAGTVAMFLVATFVARPLAQKPRADCLN